MLQWNDIAIRQYVIIGLYISSSSLFYSCFNTGRYNFTQQNTGFYACINSRFYS